MFLLNVAFLIGAGVLCIPVAMFCVEVLLATLPPLRGACDKSLPGESSICGTGRRIAVLIPAHNEQAVLEATLRTLIPTLTGGCRVLVVADNSTDATAEIARRCGAEAIERFDPDRRGKGFALDFGIQHLAHDPPDAIVFVDADCRVAQDTVELLAAAAMATGRPVQGLNLCDPDPSGGAMQMISGLAFRFKNFVRATGLARLVGTCHLTGTGMALPWQLAKHARLADDNTVEDMQLGIDLTLTGRPPLFVPQARVDSPLPQKAAAARTQRTRWEHGHLRTLLVQAPRLVGLAILHRRLSLFCLALDLAIPPLSLLVLSLLASTAGMLVAWLCGASFVPLTMLLAADVALALAVVLGWAVCCRGVVPFSALAAAPVYAIAKLPIYAAFLCRRQSPWIRTERDGEPVPKLP